MIGVSVLVGVFLLLLLIRGTVRGVVSRYAGPVADEVRGRVGADRILMMDETANFFGLESAGARQARGNGCLALTDQEVLFLQWVPRRELRIERARITGVESPTWHLGKSRGHPLLKILFTDERQAPDSAAWQVRDLEGWRTALNELPTMG